MENELEDFIRKNREAFDIQTPDSVNLQKIKNRVKAPTKIRALSSRSFQWLAAASVLLVLGLFLLWKQANTNTTVAEKNKDVFSAEKEKIFYALGNDQSATQRLAGALAAGNLDKTDKTLVDTLVKVMQTDASSNVRLASLDALGKFYGEEYVKKQTLAALSTQDDVVVKAALIEFLSRKNEASIAGELLKIVSDKEAAKQIKDQAYAGLLKLNLL